MNRKAFIRITSLATLGLPVLVNFEIEKLMTSSVEINQLLGLDTSHLETVPFKLEVQTTTAFLEMRTAANKAGIDLKIASGYRSFEHQKQIWERKYKALSKTRSPSKAISDIITYSSIPGTSRHHWGTDIDLIDGNVEQPEGDLLSEKNYHGAGAFSKLKSWMDAYAEDFGFRLVYTKDQNRTGFNYEPWHYSYAPKSKIYFQLQQTKLYQEAWSQLEFEGKFELTAAFMTSYFKNYNEGINPQLINQ